MKDYLIDTEAISSHAFQKVISSSSTQYFKDPFFKEHPYRLNKLTLDFKKINRCQDYLKDIYNDL